MKTFPLLLAVLTCLKATSQTTSQNLALENTRTKGSTRLYVGVANALLVKGNASKIVNVHAEDAEIQRANDTLFVKPARPGDLMLFIETESGTNEYAFTSNYQPPPHLLIDTTQLTIASLLTGAPFTIAQTDPDKLYANCELHSFELGIGNTILPVDPKAVSAEAINALKNKKPYYKVYLNKYVLADKNTGRKRTVRCHKELKLL